MRLRNSLTAVLLMPLVALAGLLTGCGGGGGGGVTGPITIGSFIRWSAITPPATVNIDGVSADADYVAPAPDFDVTSVTDEGFNDTASASISYRANGTISRISVNTPNGTVTWDETLGDFIDDSDPLIVTAVNAANTDIAVAVDAVPLGWEYQTFGAWETGRGTGSGTFGAISVGAPTPGASIPTLGNPVFSGATVGAYVDDTGSNDYITVRDLTVAADFGARSLAFSTDNTQNIHTVTAVQSSATDLNLSGTLSYAAGTNGFSGPLTATGGMNGLAEGRFYGPNAEELGGVFSLSGSGVEAYSGAFGGAR